MVNHKEELDRALDIIRDLLKGGEHDGPCDNEGMEQDDSCSLHVAAGKRRDDLARAFLSEFPK